MITRSLTHKRLWFCVVLMLMLNGAACSALLPKDNGVKGGMTYLCKMDYHTQGFQRRYRVHLPAGYESGKPYPLVIVVHGAFDTDQGIENISGFSRLADKEGFVVMYPNGIGILGYLQHWNAGHCCGKAADDDIDDVGFVATAIKDLCIRFNIDRQRIYMTGFSNGGMFTYRFAAEKSDILAAFAPLAGSAGGRMSTDVPEWKPPVPEKPLPVLVMHGLADDDVPYKGGVSEHRGGTRTYLSVADSVRLWTDRNPCIKPPFTQDIYGGTVHKTTWEDCQNQTYVALYAIENWGHYWPGPYFTKSLGSKSPLRPFDAAEIIWDFFKNHKAQ